MLGEMHSLRNEISNYTRLSVKAKLTCYEDLHYIQTNTPYSILTFQTRSNYNYIASKLSKSIFSQIYYITLKKINSNNN